MVEKENFVNISISMHYNLGYGMQLEVCVLLFVWARPRAQSSVNWEPDQLTATSPSCGQLRLADQLTATSPSCWQLRLSDQLTATSPSCGQMPILCRCSNFSSVGFCRCSNSSSDGYCRCSNSTSVGFCRCSYSSSVGLFVWNKSPRIVNKYPWLNCGRHFIWQEN